MPLTVAKLPNGKFKAIVKSNGRIIKTKTFSKKSLAKKWGQSLEFDQERIEALQFSGSQITFKELYSEYVDFLYKESGLKDISGKQQRSKLWLKTLSNKFLTDITPEIIEDVLETYLSGYVKIVTGNGTTKITNRKRSTSTRNRHKVELSAILKYAVNKGYIVNEGFDS